MRSGPAGDGKAAKKRARRTGRNEATRTAFFEQARDYTPYVGVTTDEGSFLVATSDGSMGWGLFVERGRPEFKVLSRAVTVIEALTGADAIVGRTFVDVGANVGTATVAALVSHRFGSAVSCEPEGENYGLLRANLALNDLEGRVRPLRVAVSNRLGRSELVVLDDRRGKSWIATDPEKIRAAEADRAKRVAEDPGMELRRRGGPRPRVRVADVELVTLERLAQSGVIDEDQVGMLWIDAEGHEGHILDGAGTLAERGVPIVCEFNPAGLDEHGDRGKIHEVAEGCYTHFVDMRRPEGDPTQPRFRMRPVPELHAHADHFLDPSTPGSFTDLLLLRLDARQARVGGDLRGLVKRRRPDQRQASADADRDDALVAFVHIPKTAGATVTSMFARAYSPAGVRNAGNYLRDPKKTAAKISRPRTARARVTVGQVPYGLFREHLPTDTRYLTFLREPVDRVLSLYHGHLRRRGDFSDDQRPVVTDSIEEALEMGLPMLNDLATRFLCGHPSPLGDLPASALDEAKANLRDFAFVGIQERFDESAVLLQRTFGLGFVPYEARHIDSDRPSVDEITDEQRSLIVRCNQLDTELYAFARGLFEDALADADEGLAAEAATLRSVSAVANQPAHPQGD